jgi:hypothetical protein
MSQPRPDRSTILRCVSLRATLPLLLVLSAACSSEPARPTGTVCTTCGDCEEDRPVTSASHVLGPIDYPDPPPAGGDHYPCWTTWGVHTDVVPAERWVHNLEHGGVVYLYRDAAPGADGGAMSDATVAELTALVQELPRTVLTQYSLLPKAYGVVAWGHRLVSDCMDEKAARDFYAKHFDQAPESIPDDPSCN